jgi:hypothetical protein
MNVPIFKRETRWVCPNCTEHDVTYEARPHTRFHSCKGLRGISAPFVEEGVDCKVEARDRDDYVGDEIVQHAPLDGRPVMSVVTTRADGSNDVAVFAPHVQVTKEYP